MTPTYTTPGILIGQDRYLTLAKVASRFNVTPKTIREWINKKGFPACTQNTKLYKQSEVDIWFTR